MRVNAGGNLGTRSVTRSKRNGRFIASRSYPRRVAAMRGWRKRRTKAAIKGLAIEGITAVFPPVALWGIGKDIQTILTKGRKSR